MSTAPTWAELRAFLDGSAPLDGVWFGDSHPRHKGNFWWRRYLPPGEPLPKTGEPQIGAGLADVFEDAHPLGLNKAGYEG